MPADCTPAPKGERRQTARQPVKRHAQRHTQVACQQHLRAAKETTQQVAGRVPGRKKHAESEPQRAARRFSMHAASHPRPHEIRKRIRPLLPPPLAGAALRSPPRAGRAPCPSGVRGWLARNCRAADLALTCCAELDCRLLDVEVAQRAMRAHPLHIRLNIPGRIKERGGGEIRGAPSLLFCCGRRRKARHGRPRLREAPAEEPPSKHGAGGGCK
jgi:hypothetical protein